MTKLSNKENKKNLVILFSAILIIIFLIAIYFLFRYKNTNNYPISKNFMINQDLSYAKPLLDINNQTYHIDNYTITLTKALYDSKISNGYVIFKIHKKNDKPNVELDNGGSPRDDKIAKRFDIVVPATCSISKRYEFKGNTLYAYVEFNAEQSYNHTIDVVDYAYEDPTTEYQHKVYTYELKNKSLAKIFTKDNTTVAISPIGMAIDTKKELKKVIINIHNKNGESFKLIDTTKSKYGMDLLAFIQSYTNTDIDEFKRYQCMFKKSKDFINVNNIDYIEFNGKVYKSN